MVEKLGVGCLVPAVATGRFLAGTQSCAVVDIPQASSAIKIATLLGLQAVGDCQPVIQ